MYIVYFARSQSNNKIYVGITEKDPQQRVTDHNNGSNKFTRHNGPFKLAYYESYVCKTDALKREKYYKSGLGKQIKKLIVEYIERIPGSSASAKG
jgi:putative endonuclease